MGDTKGKVQAPSSHLQAPSSHLRTKILRRKATPEEYRVYRAGLEWDLTDPIVIGKREDLKSEHRWRDRMEPYHHQVSNLITFCRRLPVTLVADDVGPRQNDQRGVDHERADVPLACFQDSDCLPQVARPAVAGRIADEIQHLL